MNKRTFSVFRDFRVFRDEKKSRRRREAIDREAAVDADDLSRDVGRCVHTEVRREGDDFLRLTDTLHGRVREDCIHVVFILQELVHNRGADVPFVLFLKRFSMYSAAS